MSISELMQKLVEEYGAIVHTPHHLQIAYGKGKHDIWHGKDGLKWKLAGVKYVNEGPPERLLAALGTYVPENTDLAWLQSLTRSLYRLEGKVGIFVDAGWKDGKAKVALIKIKKHNNAEIHVENFDSPSINDAEHDAIIRAFQIWGESPIHSDSQVAVNAFNSAHGGGAVWIPREANREADMIGNRRKQQ